MEEGPWYWQIGRHKLKCISTTSRGCTASASPITAHSAMCLYLEGITLRNLLERSHLRPVAQSCKSPRLRGVRSRHVIDAIIVFFALVFVTAPTLWAQSTFGSIRGTVQDASGAAIPDAQVTLHSLDENTDRVVNTDASGSYTLENVKAGMYSIHARRTGFADTVIDGIALAARQDLRFTLSMTIAAQTTTVEVTTSATEINTENAIVGDSKGTAEISQLPLNFRAATTSPLAALATSANVQQDSQGNFTIGGATSNMIGFSVDGISSVNIFQSGVALGVNAAGSNPYPSSEGIAELKVTAFNNNAEFSQVGDVTFTTKAGTNQYHGSLFEYLQNDVLNANVYNFAQKSPERFNTFGGSLGGPLSVPHLYNGHNKTFFFFDYEGNRRRTSQAEQYAVPTELDREGNLSDLASTIPVNTTNPNCPATMGCLINPTTGQPFANYQITSPLSSSSLELLKAYYPLPNANNLGGGLNYQTLVPVPSNTNGFDGRIDQVITPKQQVYARFNWKNLLVNVVNPLLPNDVDTEHDRSFLVSHNYEISSQWLNEFRFGFSHSILAPNFAIEGAQAIAQLG